MIISYREIKAKKIKDLKVGQCFELDFHSATQIIIDCDLIENCRAEPRNFPILLVSKKPLMGFGLKNNALFDLTRYESFTPIAIYESEIILKKR